MSQRISSERLYELDCAKFVAMLFMIVGHTLDALVRPTELDITVPPWSLWHWWRGITAPVFLTISGMLFAITLRRDSSGRIERVVLRRRAVRAVQLVALGYLLVLPASRIYELPFVSDDVWRMFFQVNVLQLVGFSLALLVVVALLSSDTHAFRFSTLGVGVALALLTPLVHLVSWFEHLPEFIAAYLSYEHGSLFPIFPFSAYMLVGASVGAYLAEQKEHRTTWLRRRSLQLGIALIAFGVIAAYGVPMPGVDIYRYTPFGVAIRQGVAFLLIAAMSYALPLLRSVQSLLVLFGKQALAIYVVHLVLIFGTPWFNSIGRIYPKALSLSQGILAAGAIVVMTLGGILLAQRVRPYLVRPPIARVLRLAVYGVLAYLLLA